MEKETKWGHLYLVVMRLFPMVLLLLATGHMPSGYYIFLRWTIFIICCVEFYKEIRVFVSKNEYEPAPGWIRSVKRIPKWPPMLT